MRGGEGRVYRGEEGNQTYYLLTLPEGGNNQGRATGQKGQKKSTNRGRKEERGLSSGEGEGGELLYSHIFLPRGMS